MIPTISINTSEIPEGIAKGLGRAAFELTMRISQDPRHKDLYEKYLKEEQEKCQRRCITA